MEIIRSSLEVSLSMTDLNDIHAMCLNARAMTKITSYKRGEHTKLCAESFVLKFVFECHSSCDQSKNDTHRNAATSYQ